MMTLRHGSIAFLFAGLLSCKGELAEEKPKPEPTKYKDWAHVCEEAPSQADDRVGTATAGGAV